MRRAAFLFDAFASEVDKEKLRGFARAAGKFKK
jgi:hypothetical protein